MNLYFPSDPGIGQGNQITRRGEENQVTHQTCPMENEKMEDKFLEEIAPATDLKEQYELTALVPHKLSVQSSVQIGYSLDKLWSFVN